MEDHSALKNSTIINVCAKNQCFLGKNPLFHGPVWGRHSLRKIFKKLRFSPLHSGSENLKKSRQKKTREIK